MTRTYFGTDGVRGTANQDPMTSETAMLVGKAAGATFMRGAHRHRVVIGKDTRLSCYMIETALTAGFIAVGMDVILVGPMPTPAIAMLTRSLRADLGVMISASHNLYQDNGIKLFGPDGYKLSDEVEHAIEAHMERPADIPVARPEKLGRAQRLDDAQGRYIEFVKNSFPKNLRLGDLKVVIDCANGAAYRVAPTVLWELEADVVPLGVQPDGFNINRDCGSTSPSLLQQRVVAEGADLGIALDGDADRIVLCDEKGGLIDGDQILALIARSWSEAGRLSGGGVVATVMSNLGLQHYLQEIGLSLHRTRVGDRYVVERMRQDGFNVGGEQSGHIILDDFVTTGDGLIAALQVLAVIVQNDKPVSETCRMFQPVPQILRNVRYVNGTPLDAAPVKKAIGAAEKRLGAAGRLLIRPSGTEPVIRIMAESEDEALLDSVVGDVAKAIEQAAS